jgi:CUB/sushi domain-containing protein
LNIFRFNIVGFLFCDLVVYNADARKGMEFQYFTGDCSDPAVQLEAKKAFLRAFDLFLQDQFPDYCDFEQSCKVENVQVICGQKQSIGGGRKRGVQGV